MAYGIGEEKHYIRNDRAVPFGKDLRTSLKDEFKAIWEHLPGLEDVKIMRKKFSV